MRVYLAGKIHKSYEFGLDWRTRFTNGVHIFESHDGSFFDETYQVKLAVGLTYVGPFVLSDNHGSVDINHGEFEHGKAIYDINSLRMKNSDFVFAYIDSFTAFGTFFEIGYAASINIPIYLCIDPSLVRHGDTNDLWYLRQSATACFEHEDVSAAFYGSLANAKEHVRRKRLRVVAK